MIEFNPTALTEAVAKVAAEAKDLSNAPAMVVSVSNGGLTVQAAAGVKNSNSQRPAPTDGAFEIGSQTKMMTAVVILQLVEEGKLSLDDKAADFLPAATIQGLANADQVTIRQLLNMTAGLGNYTEATDADGNLTFIRQMVDHPHQVFGPDRALAIARTMAPTGAPGESFHYSNTNYLLLGQIIEGLTGQGFVQAITDRVLNPVHMAHTVAQLNPGDDRLSSYATLPDGTVMDVTRLLWEMHGEAGLVSTTADMTAFLRALLIDKALLSDASLALMTNFEQVELEPGLTVGFGLGLINDPLFNDTGFVGFSGGTLGTSSSTYYDAVRGLIMSAAGTSGEGAAYLAAVGAWDAARGAIWRVQDFDQNVHVTSVSAAALQVGREGEATKLASGGAILRLDRELAALVRKTVSFADGSVLLVGDMKAGTAGDALGNHIDLRQVARDALTHDNRLMGLGGNDCLRGGLGNDALQGGFGNDTLLGGNGSDALLGGAGRDRLEGGAGNDNLMGGAGADVFVFAPNGQGKIRDFQAGIDRIDLQTGGTPWHLVGEAAFSGHAGELRLVQGAQMVQVSGDADGDGTADLTITILGSSPAAQDFLL